MSSQGIEKGFNLYLAACETRADVDSAGQWTVGSPTDATIAVTRGHAAAHVAAACPVETASRYAPVVAAVYPSLGNDHFAVGKFRIAADINAPSARCACFT